MPIKITMPALSPTMTHGNLSSWLKKEGDMVKAGEVMAEIETDKATMEVEAVDEGKIAKILVKAGSEEVAVGTVIAILLGEDEADADIDSFLSLENSSKNSSKSEIQSTEEKDKFEIKESEPKPEPKPEAKQDPEKNFAKEISPKNNENQTRIFASPLAKRIAKIENFDLTSINGTGPHNRIIKADIMEALEKGNNRSGEISRNQELYKLVPNSNMRKVIAKRLLESKQQIPHFYLEIEACVDKLLEARADVNSAPGNAKAGKISVNDFIIMASSRALREIPEINASWSNEAIMQYNNIDISVAVSIDGGLITPIIQNADQKTISQISKEMKNLALRARLGELKPQEYQGGGFSISNLGMYGIKSFNAIINPPQGCILSVGASIRKPVIEDEKIKIKTMMNLNLSCDHRIIDGVVGAKFLNSLKKFIESPILMFI